ncbi:MAG TPA: phospholipase D-like domain-containing protein [Puia sp.]
MSKKRTPRLLAGYTHHNKVRLVHGGSDYFTTLLQMIDQAKTIVHLQTYIYEDDETGRTVSAALLRAAQRKVLVYVLLDGYASQDLSKDMIKEWREAGIRFRWFWPLIKSRNFYFGRRMHHKVLAVDGSYGLAGGVNISDRYNDIGGQKAWFDRALFVEGEAALKLHIICRDMWTKAYWKKDGGRREKFAWLPGIIPDETCMVRVRRNDWVQGKSQISRSYLEMFRNAHSHITILSSYFLPGSIFRRQMALAARRGVKIKVIVGNISDVKISRYAERFMYRWLLRNKIEVYEYLDTILHGKLATYDGHWMTNGSYNVNKISAYASVELNMDVRNADFVQKVEEELDDIIQRHCVRITAENIRHSAFAQFMQWLSFQTIRVIFFLFTFYFRQEKGG